VDFAGNGVRESAVWAAVLDKEGADTARFRLVLKETGEFRIE
jgi:hypothetical protein